MIKQESIPEGCVPSTSVAITRMEDRYIWHTCSPGIPTPGILTYLVFPPLCIPSTLVYPPWYTHWSGIPAPVDIPTPQKGPGSRHPPGQTHACESITFPQLPWRAVTSQKEVSVLHVGYPIGKRVSKCMLSYTLCKIQPFHQGDMSLEFKGI